jgi:2-methylisocitrate lyase-like PEP mutase family enzyme
MTETLATGRQNNSGVTAPIASFRDRIAACVEGRHAMIVPGAANALSARIIADLQFEAVYVTGAGVTNMYLGLPDMGFLSLTQLAEHTTAIRDAVPLPIIVDADTGFGNALNVHRTVRVLQRAGANAIQIEDQVSPKRCGHFAGKEVIPVVEMLEKIHAAVDARSSADLLIIARTDARAVDGFQAAVDRASAYMEAGADITFVEAPETLDEMRRIPQLLAVPQIVNMVVGGKTPIVDASELSAMGFAIVLYANAALQGAILGMQNALRELKERGRLDERSAALVSFAERQRLVQKPLYDELERKYARKNEDEGK